MAQWKRIPLGTMRFRIQSLASPSEVRIRHCYDVGRRCGSDLALMWLWCRLAAIALIRPPSPGTSICHGRKKGRKEGRKEGRRENKDNQYLTFKTIVRWGLHNIVYVLIDHEMYALKWLIFMSIPPLHKF